MRFINNLLYKLSPFPLLRQRDYSECGSVCVAMVLKYYGLGNLVAHLRESTGVAITGTNLHSLANACKAFGFTTQCLNLGINKLLTKRLPAIIHIDNNHFAVAYRTSKKYIWLADPALGKLKLTHTEFQNRWNGITLLIEPDDEDKMATGKRLAKEHQEHFRTLRREYYYKTLQPVKKLLVYSLLITFILQLLAMALPFFTQGMIDLVLPSADIPLLYQFLLALGFVFVGFVGFSYLRNRLLATASMQFENRFFYRLFSHLLAQKQSYFDQHQKEDFLKKFEEKNRIRNAFSANILQSVFDLVFIINFVVVMFYYNINLSLLATGFILVSILITIVFTPRIRVLEQSVYQQNMLTTGVLLDTLYGIQTLKYLHAEKKKLAQWDTLHQDALHNIKNATLNKNLYELFFRAISLAGQISVYGYGAMLTIDNSISLGEYMAFVTIFTIAMYSVERVSSLWYLITDLSISFNRINDIFLQKAVDDGSQPDLAPISSPDINISSLTFSYNPNSDKSALQDININIPYGSHTGIVGRNGSGKTTLVKLIAGLYAEYDGSLMLGKHEVRDIPAKVLRNMIAVVPQDVYLFTGTIRDNILLAAPDATDEVIYQALEWAELAEDVKQFYLGLDHNLIQNGGNLSSGQRRKLAFARLFVSKPGIILLDEASSALDIETEQKILANVVTVFDKQTIISVAHRIYTVKSSDQILVIDQGQLVESGNHEKLVEQQGVYYQFINTYLENQR